MSSDVEDPRCLICGERIEFSPYYAEGFKGEKTWWHSRGTTCCLKKPADWLAGEPWPRVRVDENTRKFQVEVEEFQSYHQT